MIQKKQAYASQNEQSKSFIIYYNGPNETTQSERSNIKLVIPEKWTVIEKDDLGQLTAYESGCPLKFKIDWPNER